VSARGKGGVHPGEEGGGKAAGARTRILKAVGRQPQLARAAEVRKVDKAAEDVQPCIHGPHAQHASSHANDVLAGWDGGSGVDVGQELNEQADGLLIFAVLAHDHLVVLLHVSEGVREVVQRTLAAVQRTRGRRELAQLFGDGLGSRARANLLVARRNDRLARRVTHLLCCRREGNVWFLRAVRCFLFGRRAQTPKTFHRKPHQPHPNTPNVSKPRASFAV
jgi:hypothetical protein